MLQPRIWASARTILPCSSLSNCSSLLATSLSQRPILHLPSSLKTSPPNTRPASHAAQGRANKAAPGPGKRLGAKKTDSELVVPGNIIFRQRGTHWFPGENCGMGRDHTIFALEKGYVRYYRDPEKHKDRKYIGIVFDRGWSLPRGRGAARRRRLGLEARDMSTDAVGAEPIGGAFAEAMAEREGNEGSNEVKVARAHVATSKGVKTPDSKPKLELKDGYLYRESNWQIGRAAERAKFKVREYKAGDRFLAWRKTNARKARNVVRRGLRRK